MSFGIQVFNETGIEVLNSEDPPFRFVTAAEPFQAVNISGNWYNFRRDITGRYTPSAMIYVEAQSPMRPLWGSETTRVHYAVREEGGRTYLYLTSGGWDRFVGIPGQPPLFYIVDRIRPAQAAAGYGINAWDSAGLPVINSSTPLAQVDEVVQSPTSAAGLVATALFGPASARICIIENIGGGLSQSRYTYPGGGGVTIRQWYSIDIQIVSGVFQVTAVFWDEETGESPSTAPWIIPVRCILLKKPSKPYGW